MNKYLIILFFAASVFAQNEKPRGLVVPLEIVSGWHGSGQIKQPIYYAALKLNPEWAFADNIIRIGLNNGVFFSNPGVNGFVGAKMDFRLWALHTPVGLVAEVRTGIAYSYSFEKNSQVSAELKAIPLNIMFFTLRFTKILKGSNYLGEFGFGLNLDYLFRKKRSNSPFDKLNNLKK